MSELAISVRDLSKSYKLYATKLDRLREALHPGGRRYHQEFHALHRVSFEVERGEVLGIVGRNGSGKSTLLKILTGILQPTSGAVETRGRVSALLELGTGFNPELTGVENVFFNGTLLGFSRAEVAAHLDEVLAFADIGEFARQPLKTYSSGMIARLGFAVTTYTRPEILIIDEALAVGDARFVFKCMNHMRRLMESGATIVFVTHDIQAARSFCRRVIWLDQGRVRDDGDPRRVTAGYVEFLFGDGAVATEGPRAPCVEDRAPGGTPANTMPALTPIDEQQAMRWGPGDVRVVGYSLRDHRGVSLPPAFEWDEPIVVGMLVEATRDVDSPNLHCSFAFKNANGLDVVVGSTIDEGNASGPLRAGDQIFVEFRLDNLLRPGDYALVLAAEERISAATKYFDYVECACIFKVISSRRGLFFAPVQPRIHQTVERRAGGQRRG